MTELAQDIKITCQSSIIKGSGAQSVEGHPLRNWKVKLVAVEDGREIKGRLSRILDHVEYVLHPTFQNPRRVVKKEPYVLQEKGWGEFDLRIVLYFVNNYANTEVIVFDLNFRQTNYSVVHTVFFDNPSPEFIALLNEEVTGSQNSKKRHSTSKDRPLNTKKARATVSPMVTSGTRTRPGIDYGPGTSPSTPFFSQNNNNGYPSSSAYSASSPIPSLSSPNSGEIMSSPYEFAQGIRTPQASEYDNASYASDINEEEAQSSSSRRRAPRSQRSSDSSGHRSDHLDERRYRRQQQQQNGYHHGSSSSSSDDSINDDVLGNGRETTERPIVDDVYTESDIENINPIHGATLDPEVRRAWGIPPEVNMRELARRLSTLSRDRLTTFYQLIEENKTDDMTVRENDGELVLDLYSLGFDLLAKLWEFTSESASQAAQGNGHHATNGDSNNTNSHVA